MHITSSSVSTSPTRTVEAWKSSVQSHVSSSHHPTYNIIGAALRPRSFEDDVPVKPVAHRSKTPSASSHSSNSSSPSRPSKSSSSLLRKTVKRSAPVTRENLFKISMACAREEDLDAPYRTSEHVERRRTDSDSSLSSSSSSSDLPRITEEEE